jgi:hypothetical protein
MSRTKFLLVACMIIAAIFVMGRSVATVRQYTGIL